MVGHRWVCGLGRKTDSKKPTFYKCVRARKSQRVGGKGAGVWPDSMMDRYFKTSEF